MGTVITLDPGAPHTTNTYRMWMSACGLYFTNRVDYTDHEKECEECQGEWRTWV